MESKLKAAAMDSVGELPAGYLHLPTTPIKQEPQLTDWINGIFKPVRDGVYERKYSNGTIFAKWEKDRWYKPSSSIILASKTRAYSKAPYLPWRGLSSNPNEVQS